MPTENDTPPSVKCPCGITLMADETLYGACPLCVDFAAFRKQFEALVDPAGPLELTLRSVGNPDYGQNPNRALPGVPKLVVRVATLRAASTLCQLYIAYYELGGGNWPNGKVADVSTGKRKALAEISYNGRAWKPGKYPQPEIAL